MWPFDFWSISAGSAGVARDDKAYKIMGLLNLVKGAANAHDQADLLGHTHRYIQTNKLNLTEKYGLYPIIAWIIFQNLDVGRALVNVYKENANPAVRDGHGKNALDYAIATERLDFVESLCQFQQFECDKIAYLLLSTCVDGVTVSCDGFECCKGDAVNAVMLFKLVLHVGAPPQLQKHGPYPWYCDLNNMTDCMTFIGEILKDCAVSWSSNCASALKKVPLLDMSAPRDIVPPASLGYDAGSDNHVADAPKLSDDLPSQHITQTLVGCDPCHERSDDCD